jgi:hypothetical protein
VLKKLDVVVFVGVACMASMTAKWCAMRFHITCVITGLDPVILQTLSVVPANAGTHSHRLQLFGALVVNWSFPQTMAAAYGVLRSQERRVRDRSPIITGLDPVIQLKSHLL